MTSLAPCGSLGATPRRIQGCDIVRVLVGAVLLTAAGMKGYELATGPVAEKSLLTSRWFLIAAVEFELALGLSLVSGLWKKLAWRVAVLTFIGFACLTASKAWHGEASCGCFGSAEVDPRFTLVLDIVLLAALLAWPPRFEIQTSPTSWRRTGAVAAVLFCIGVPVAVAMARVRAVALTADGDALGTSSFVALEPDKWIGTTLPLIPYIDVGEQLRVGHWIILLYRHDCLHCQQVLPQYREFANNSCRSRPRVLVLELPPYGHESDRVLIPCVRGRLDSSREWLVQTPCVVETVDGTVVAPSTAPALETVQTSADYGPINRYVH